MRVSGLTLAALGMMSLTAAATPTYTIIDLGTLPGTTESIATGINAQGQVTGVSYTSSNGAWSPSNAALSDLGVSYDAGAKSFLYSNGQMTQINPTNGPATSINNSGQVVGGNYSSINNTGQYVGGGGFVTSNQASDPNQLVSGGTTTSLNIVPFAINDSGQIGGRIDFMAKSEDFHAAIYQNGQITDLSNALGLKGQFDEVIALNNSGSMLILEGEMSGANPVHFLLYNTQTKSLTDLTNLPGGSGLTALELNDQNQVVGTNFLYSGGQYTSLQSLIPNSSGWSNLIATGINNAGQIVGEGLIDGQEQAFLMTPQTVPEPGTLVILGLGFAAWVIRSRSAGVTK